MIFVGDVALGQKGMRLVISRELSEKLWFLNLEGSLVKNGEFYIPLGGVFNDFSSIKDLSQIIKIKGLSLANNHILDVEPFCVTLSNLKSLGIPFVGSGRIVSEAAKPIDIEEYSILSFGWECIECPKAGPNKEGVNPYNKENVLCLAKKELSKKKKVVCFMHWNYEFELYPQPYDRELAHQLIDMGIYAVIGAHAHRVQHIEMYKGHPIVYGLGNFMFSRNLFFNHRLDFGERSKDEIAFELKSDGTFAVHKFEYSHEEDEVKYVGTKSLDSTSKGNAPYENMNNKEYALFFKKHRIQKKLLPVFYYDDSPLTYWLKCKFIAVRGKILSVLVKIGIKGQKR